MVSKVMYGGRAIDNFDRRILGTYMNEYIGDFIFDSFQPFHFYHDSAVDYCIPESGARDVYVGRCCQCSGMCSSLDIYFVVRHYIAMLPVVGCCVSGSSGRWSRARNRYEFF